jgi:hypothetical protein
LTKGVEDLDFFIGDEAFDATGYAVKVSVFPVVVFWVVRACGLKVSVNKSTWCHNPADHNRLLHNCENLQSQ